MDPPMPENYFVGEVLGDGDSFFSSVAQGLEQVRGGNFNEKMLRQECKKYAQSCRALHTTIGEQDIDEYIAQIECSPFRGRPKVDGIILSKIFSVNIYIIEKQCSDNLFCPQDSSASWLNNIVDESGYRPVECVHYEVPEMIYITEGDLNFKPILKRICESYPDNDGLHNGDDKNGETDIYEVREGTSGASGHFYEIKLLMLFLLRLRSTNKFHLAQNMADVGAFDDVVFKYHIKNNDGAHETKTIFLQAKHSDASEAGNITLDSLLSPKGAFSLKKYFKSYRDIERNFQTVKSPIFKGNFADCNFVIFTNYILEEPKTNSQRAERWRKRWIDKEADGFVIAKGERSQQLTIDKDINGDIIEKLARSPLGQLAQEIYDYVFDKKKDTGIRIENEIFQEYHICLANEVFEVSRNKPKVSKFRSTFLDGNRLWNELYQIANGAQCISKDDFKNMLNTAKVNLFKTFGNIQLSLETKTSNNLATELANIIGQCDSDFIKIDNPPSGIAQLANNVLVRDDVQDFAVERVKFGKTESFEGKAKNFMETLKEKLKEKQAENAGCQDIELANIRFEIDGLPRFSLPGPDEDVTENEVTQFLSKLEFALGQKNENDLDDVIKKEIRECRAVEHEAVDIVYESVKYQVEKWWKYGKHFLTCGNKFVKNALTSIKNLELSAFTNFSQRGIKKTEMRFDDTAVSKCNKLLGQKQLLNIVSSKGTTLLSSVKVCQTLDKNLGDNSYIFVQLNYLLYIQDHALQIFLTNNTKHLMVIENNSGYEKEFKWSEEDFKKLHVKLHEIIMKDKRKKVVLVTEEDDMLANHLMNDTVRFHQGRDDIDLNHLTMESQAQLMENAVMLHGKRIKMRDFIGIGNQNANRAITSHTIMNIVKNHNLVISNAPQDFSTSDAAYTKLYKKISLENLVEELKTCSKKNATFVISGIKKQHTGTLHDELLKQLQIKDPALVQTFKQGIGTYDGRKYDKSIIMIANTKEADPLKEFGQICFNKNKSIIYWVDITVENVRLQQVYEPNFYMKRQFIYMEKIVLNLELILQNCQTSLFIFNDIDRMKVEMLVNNLNMEAKQQQFVDNYRNGIIRFSTADRENEFPDNCAVHFLKIDGDDNGQLVWEKSKGSLEQLREFIDEQKSKWKLYDEKQFSKDIKDKVVIIAGNPGMGKTTCLTSIFQEMLDDSWVIRINFIDCKESIRTLPDAKLTLEDLYNFVSKVKSTDLGNYLAKQLLLLKLDPKEPNRRQILIMFDGYDEISSEEQTKIIPLLQYIQLQTSAKLWVTTRLHTMYALENSLSTFATKIEPLVLDEQKTYLNRFWRVRLAPLLDQKNTENISVCSTKLIDHATGILGQTISRSIEVPLQLQMLAEGFTHEVLHYFKGDKNSPNFCSLNLLKLYHKLIDKKYEIYLSENMREGKLSPSIRKQLVANFNQNHEKSAVNILFPNIDCHHYLKRITNEEKDDLQSIGITQSYGMGKNPAFIHRTFAEYFAAKFFCELFEREEYQSYEVRMDNKLSYATHF